MLDVHVINIQIEIIFIAASNSRTDSTINRGNVVSPRVPRNVDDGDADLRFGNLHVDHVRLDRPDFADFGISCYIYVHVGFQGFVSHVICHMGHMHWQRKHELFILLFRIGYRVASPTCLVAAACT